MNTALLVLLVGELTAPFRVELERALPAAFPAATPEVVIGAQAPPGRTVAWVTLSGRDAELVLHTARIPGDLRRVLRFSERDSLKERAKTVAFTLAAMVDEREAALRALAPSPATDAGVPEPPPHEIAADAGVVAPPAETWRLAAAGFATLDLPGAAPGGGASVSAHYFFRDWLAAGLGADFAGVSGARSTRALFPSIWVEALARPGSTRARPLFALGAGLSVLLVSRASQELTAPRPLFRALLGVDVKLTGPHHVSGGVALHLTPGAVSVGSGGSGSTTEVGPAWLRFELGYAGAF